MIPFLIKPLTSQIQRLQDNIEEDGRHANRVSFESYLSTSRQAIAKDDAYQRIFMYQLIRICESHHVLLMLEKPESVSLLLLQTNNQRSANFASTTAYLNSLRTK
ncbi:hypothetical protein AVEN_215944-1 [Araneus ventricosus]|uniref:Uncharacterized protein n=1 Tax=Araneus ventricosus TaxID=182803 RepID=A0A4Y2HH33_ARAVE|nr:hypothetical protein AVEN_215944-1 [Araneus ventricosus]